MRDLELGSGTDADPKEIGRRAALMAASLLKWQQELGPLLEAKDVETLLGVGTRQAVADLRARKRLLGLQREDGRVLYPAFQFGPKGRPFEEMPAILEAFGSAVGPWTIASWFTTPNRLLEGRTPAGWLGAGTDTARAVAAAGRSAARLGR
jgi:hypothetical protein